MALPASLSAVIPACARAQTPPQKVRVETSFEYYELPDSTLSEVVARLNETRLDGPDGPLSQGLTVYRIDPSWKLSAADGACGVSDVELRVSVDITLPAWPAVWDRSEKERLGWARIERAIREHELHHRDLTVRAAETLVAELEGLSTRGCRALRQAFAGALSIADDRLRQAHADYDRATPRRLSIGR
jgi:predicted secreted Zn-dependent protease